MSPGIAPIEAGQAREHEREALAASLSLFSPAEEQLEAVKPPAERMARCAVLVVHGMGQQLRFETLDALANGLYREDIRRYGPAGVAPVGVAHVQFGTERVERVEMLLRRSATDYRAVDLYETYWAPLTEGAVTLRDVIAFLFDAGINGIKNASGTFVRRIFGQVDAPLIPVRSLLFLVTALWVTLSLIVIDAAVVAIPAARSPFTTPPKWLSNELFSDFTNLFNATVLVVEAFIVSILVSLIVSRRPWFRAMPGLRFWAAILLAWLSLGLFVVAVFAILATGLAVPLIFALHAYRDSTTEVVSDWITHIGAPTPQITMGLSILVVIFGVYYFLRSVLGSFFRQFRRGPFGSLVVSMIVVVLFGALVYGVVRVGFGLIGLVPAGGNEMRSLWQNILAAGPVWAVLVLVSLVARRFLIQYAGDVAAYIQPHTVDRFYKLRIEIKDVVRKIAEAVFAQRDGGGYVYDRIILVGHSLGSVIAYDILNRLLLDDASTAEAGRPYHVAERTKLLLTFGSPLDKIAFVFTTQPRKGATTQVREALAAVVQPLIDSAPMRVGIRWLNVYSPWDIISGRLDFYNDPLGRVPPVENVRDPEAVTFLGAHTEYWRDWLLFERLHRAAI